MELRFKKEELSFLGVYAKSSEQTTPYSDKFQVKSIDGSESIAFTMSNSKVDIISYVEGKNSGQDTFLFTYDINKVYSILNFCSDGIEIIIKDDVIYFGSDSEYKFDKYDFSDLLDFSAISEVINNRDSLEVLSVNDLDKLSLISMYLGKEDQGLNVIGFFDNNFVISDRENGTGIVKTTNNIDQDRYFPDMLYYFSNLFKMDSCDLFLVDDYNKYMFKAGNSYIFMPYPENVALPNIFEEDLYNAFNHDKMVVIDKSEFFNDLKKLNVISSEHLASRVYLSVTKNSIVMENKEGIYGKEIVGCESIADFESINFITSSTILLSMIRAIPNDKIIFRLDEDMDVFSIHNETDTVRFVLAVYDYVE